MWSIWVSKNSSSSTQSIFDGFRTHFSLSLELLLPELLPPSLLLGLNSYEILGEIRGGENANLLY